MRVLTVTVGAAATQVTTNDTIYVTSMLVRASGTDYLGDNAVSATNGMPLTTTPLSLSFNTIRGSKLSQYWVSGGNGDKVTILYETSE